MYYLLLLLLAIVPSVVIMFLVNKNDKDKEPTKLLISLFGMGILSCFLTLCITATIKSFGFDLSDVKKDNYIILILYTFVQIGLVEEFSKWILNYIVIWNNKEFDQMYDSIVYASFVALGFATFENVLYVLVNGITTAILRSVLSVPAHAFYGITMGYYLGLSKLTSLNNDKKKATKYFVYSLLVPSLLHGLFDFCLLSQKIIFLLIFFALIIYLYINGIKKVKQFARVENNLVKKEIIYCPSCGSVIEGNFCSKCGSPNPKNVNQSINIT